MMMCKLAIIVIIHIDVWGGVPWRSCEDVGGRIDVHVVIVV